MAGDDSRAKRPRDYVNVGNWPDAALSDHHGAQVAQQVARALAEAMRAQRLSAKRLGALSGVNRQTIANVLAGSVWADLLTVANLEHALNQRLWPGLPAGAAAPAAPAIANSAMGSSMDSAMDTAPGSAVEQSAVRGPEDRAGAA